jgi:Tfp pilus assembly protein PilP
MKNALIAWIAASLLLLGAGPSAAAPSPSSGTKPPEKKQEVSKDEAAKTGEQEEEYTYDPQGKTDPFAAFVVRQEKSLSQIKESDVSEDLQKVLAILQDLKRPKTELQTIPLPAIQLTAIVKAEDQSVAMVRGPNGGKGFLIKKGTYIGKNGGVVEEIVNEERATDLGTQLVRKVVIKEPYLDTNRKISYRHVELKMPGSFD